MGRTAPHQLLQQRLTLAVPSCTAAGWRPPQPAEHPVGHCPDRDDPAEMDYEQQNARNFGPAPGLR